MGNYLTKLKKIIVTVLPLGERTKAIKRKLISSGNNEEDFEEELNERLVEEVFENSEESVVNNTNDDEQNNGELVNNGVSLRQLNSIMNRMNQSEALIRNSGSSQSVDIEESRTIRNSDLEGLLFARNRLASVTGNRGQAKLFRSSSIQNSSPKSSSGSSPIKYSVDMKLSTPARKKMRSTTDYIYTTLFINGENSDLCVTALNKEWKLHKIYLCQSPYFDSMFKNGSRWKESNQSSMKIAIPDENINEKSLFIAFGSFYKEDIEIVPLEVVNVLACASLFSLDGLISKCAEIMIDNINYKSVVGFYEASLTYGVKSVTDTTLKWLSHNLMSSSEFFLADLKLLLFEKILSTNELLIIQVETDLYTLCKKWLYFQLNKPTIPGVKLDKSWQKTCNDFFKSFLTIESSHGANDLNDSGTDEASLVLDVGSTSFSVPTTSKVALTKPRKECLLDKPAFFKYVNLFKQIRLQHILTDMASLHVLYSDRIIPHEWIEPHYFRNWLNTIYIDQDQLSHEFEIAKEEFDNQCARFGRALAEDTPATWRWVGFNYGIDLLISHTSRTLTLKRNTLHMYSPYKGLLSQKSTQRIYYIMKIVQLDSFGNEKWSTQTDLTCLDLNRNEEKFVVSINSNVQYPVLLNFRVATHPYYSNNLMINNLLN